MLGFILKAIAIVRKVFGLHPSHVATITAAEQMAYLVQAVDASGALATIDTAMTLRKHDWNSGANSGRGTLASDSVQDTRPNGPVAIQTFDFGYTDAGFGRFDLADGDGGQVLQIVDGWASVVMTQDGGAGVQWFIGAVNPRLGWLMFRDDVTDQWQTITAALNDEGKPTSRPWLYNLAWTRYRKQPVTLPFLLDGLPSPSRVLDAIVCEHYSGPTVSTSNAMERFVFAKGFGLVRWERWVNPAIAAAPATAAAFAASGRLPPAPELDGLLPSQWVPADGRCWTNMCSYSTPQSVRQFGWQAAQLVT